MNRKQLIKGIGFGIIAASLPQQVFSLVPAGNTKRKRALRFAHITDTHMQPEKDAAGGLTRCLHHIQAMADKPDFIINGGDTIMDALEKEKSRVEEQWALWHSVIKSECSLSIEHCIGNHDVWGLASAKQETLYGKKYALEMMKLEKPYRSFNRGGWHFIVLDSTHLNKEDKWYTAKLDEEQMQWLKSELAAVDSKTPVILVSHIPILSAAVSQFGGMMKNGTWTIPGPLMHTDAEELISLFHTHSNVKLCISGHLHLSEQLQYNNVTYLCNGAVSGAWWKGPFHQTSPGYAVIDLYADGTFDRQYVPYT